jgi:hypothetical protein
MNMNAQNKLHAAALLAAITLSTGCAQGPVAVEEDYGKSVRQMVELQTADPTAPADTNAIDRGDGERLNNVIDVYRKDVGRPESVREQIDMEIDSSN